MQALSRMQELCAGRQIRFYVGNYRDAQTHAAAPAASLEYESVIRKNLEQAGIESFMITSHSDRLPVAASRIFWNDPHPSASAVELIVADISRAIEP